MSIRCSDVHPRYLRIDTIIPKIKKPLIIENDDSQKKSFQYSDIMSQLSPFAALASKNANIAELFETFLHKLYDLKIEINKGMPSTIPEAGRLATIASKHVVLGGKPKLKQIRQCTIYGSS